ncbi:MAG: hypothetical protein RIE74_01795 [Pseudomonadales bacterium]
MVRLTDLPDYEQEHLLSKNLPPLGPPVWTTPTKPRNQMRLALVAPAQEHGS